MEKNLVSDESNWRATITNELKVAREWEESWGFLRGYGGDEGKPLTTEDKIEALEKELEDLTERTGSTLTSTYSKMYGGKTLEQFGASDYGIKRSKELMSAVEY
eukprot:PLAT1983.1.p1 GENE.PLAT1983.1~~PLAT1983.1.p1  ORF type:complete len:104 (+),score=43.87 PLAT1983.1:48-359(+)